MRTLFNRRPVALTVAALFMCGYAALNAATFQTPSEGPNWEISASHLLGIGLTLPSYMPTIWEIRQYQSNLATHQELTVEWNLIPASDRPVRKEAVAEGSLSKSFVLLDRKQNVQGGSPRSSLTLSEMTLVTVAVTKGGEIRGLAVGPGSPLSRPELLHMKPGQEAIAVVHPKETFVLSLPDDQKITRLIFFLSHPDGAKYRLEQVGTLELKAARSSS